MRTSVAVPASYKISALGRAALVMWRGWRITVVVVMLTAVIQAVMSAVAYSPTNIGWNVLSSVLSALVFLVASALVTASAHLSLSTSVSWAAVVALLRRHGRRFVLWLVGLILVTSIGLALYTWPGILLLALTPYVLLSSIAGDKNPLATNFRAIGQRFWRWLVTALIVTMLALLSYIVFGFTEFFLRGVLGASVIWIIIGFATAWIMTAWALILHATRTTDADISALDGTEPGGK
jgi:hypothetical protein